MNNTVKHYQNIHTDCDPDSRCKKDSNYEPSKLIIQDAKAIALYEKAIQSTVIYSNPQDYIFAMDTYYVESFNNVLNMFHDKRIAFQNEEYTGRSELAVCHWSENVNRDYTSTWSPAVFLLWHSLGFRAVFDMGRTKRNAFERNLFRQTPQPAPNPPYKLKTIDTIT